MQSRHVAGLVLATAVVAGLHGLLVRLEVHPPPSPRTAPAPLQWITLAAPPPPAAIAPAPPAPPAAVAAQARPMAGNRPRTAPAPVRPRQATAADQDAPSASPPEVHGSVAAPPAPPPLNLELPSRRGQAPSMVEQARNDPRIHAAPLSPSERFAQNLGTDQAVHEERRGEGRWRVRQGTGCAELRTSRAAQLDPYREAIMPSPKQVEPCNQ